MLMRIKAALRDFSVAFAGAGIMITDFSQATLSIQGLAALVAEKGASVLADRLRAIEMGRSVARTVLIDTNENYKRETTSVAGLSDVLDRLSSRLAAAVDMPLTLLMGQSPKGLGNEGDSDVRFYYDRIKNIQTRRLMRPLRRIIKLAMMALNNRKEPKKWSIKFAPFWQLSDGEIATAR